MLRREQEDRHRHGEDSDGYMAVQARKGCPALAAPTPEAGSLLGSDVFHLEFVGLIIKKIGAPGERPGCAPPSGNRCKDNSFRQYSGLCGRFLSRHRKMHRHMRQAADRDSVPPGIQDRGRETYRNTRKHREAGREADWRQARRGTRNTGLYRGRPGLAQAPWNRQGSRQDDSKDSALGIQDCAGGQSGTRAGAVKRARQRTGNGAKVRSCRPLAAGRH